MINWYLIYAYALVLSFGLSALLTAGIRRLAIRWGIYDMPGDRKMQSTPVPLLGGVAIFVSFNLVIAANLFLLEPVRQFGLPWVQQHVLSFLGPGVALKLAGITAGGLIIFALGVWDDLRTLGPEPKLAGQIAAAVIVAASGIRLDLFLPGLLSNTLFETLASMLLTVFWILLLVNAMNFLDNMDGLAGGISVIAALSLCLCLMPHDTFVCILLTIFAGSVAGFLLHNINPARIYMGDAGSMFCGYTLAVAAVLATYYTPDTPSRVAVLAPLLALSVPLFDTSSVIFIRLRNGESIMKGDKRHFSHRLVRLGMTPFQAVSFIYIVGLVSGMSAVVLPQLNVWGTWLLVLQVIILYGLIVLLMQAGMQQNHRED